MHTVPIAIAVSACTDFKHCHGTSMGVLIYLVLGVAFVGSADECSLLFKYRQAGGCPLSPIHTGTAIWI